MVRGRTWASMLGLVLMLGVVCGCGADTTTPARPAEAATAAAPTGEPATAAPPVSTPTEIPPEPTAVPTPDGPQATVIDVVNDVSAHALPDTSWGPAEVAMPIYLQGEVWAKEASTARVGLDSAVIRVAPNTIFTHEQPDSDTVRVQLGDGQLWINVEGLEPGEAFEVETPNGVASVRGTRFSVRITADGSTIVSTQVDTVTLAMGSEVVTVTQGTQSVVPPGGAPEPPVPMTLAEQLRWGVAVGGALDVVMPVVGEVITLTQPGQVSNAQISPDGRYLAYFYYRRENEVSYYGTQLYDLVAGEFVEASSLDQVDGFHFSPQGDQIAYVTLKHGEDQVCTAPVGDWDVASCFGGAAHYGWPRWSPDGEWLFFYAQMVSGTSPWGLYRARPDGSELTLLNVDNDLSAFDPAWSPDGAWIAYASQVPGDFDAPGDVWLIRPDGSDAHRVFEGAHGHHGLAWSPDSAQLAIRGAETGLYLYNVALDDVQPVTNTVGVPCTKAVWSPTADGWPLLFQTYDPETGIAGPLTTLGDDGSLTALADVSWGPVWLTDGSRAIFGALDTVQGLPVTSIYVADNQPAFYP